MAQKKQEDKADLVFEFVQILPVNGQTVIESMSRKSEKYF